MPIVEIHLMEGRSDEQKRAMVKKVTEAICETANVPPKKVRIIINDMAPNNYSIAGELILDRKTTDV